MASGSRAAYQPDVQVPWTLLRCAIETAEKEAASIAARLAFSRKHRDRAICKLASEQEDVERFEKEARRIAGVVARLKAALPS